MTTICSDTTGTLTTNEMTATVVRTRAHEFAVTGTGYAPHGDVVLAGPVAATNDHPDLASLTEVMSHCNDANVAGEDGACESATKDMAALAAGADGARHVVVTRARPDPRPLHHPGEADGAAEPLEPDFWTGQIDELGRRGLRVLAAARVAAAPDASTLAPSDVDTGLQLVGLVGIVDPPAPRPSRRSPCAAPPACTS